MDKLWKKVLGIGIVGVLAGSFLVLSLPMLGLVRASRRLRILTTQGWGWGLIDASHYYELKKLLTRRLNEEKLSREELKRMENLYQQFSERNNA
jgi:hypothetical protein